MRLMDRWKMKNRLLKIRLMLALFSILAISIELVRLLREGTGG
jgi:hypothetical protein